ncbi:MAG: DUF3786 domain-containing protein [Deltaproteobacteria bacterium]|nr:DUF3786 domain-containing protein [Deltaproteobacteria bacterium]
MPRIDDFKQAKELTKKELSGKDPDLIATLSGAVIHRNDQGDISFSLDLINRDVIISWPDLQFKYNDSAEELPIQQQAFLLHYLHGALSSKGASVTGEWISFQDIPDGRFYLGAFMKRAKDPLLKTFGHNPKQMVEIASKAYGASPLDHGDYSVVVKALPLVPIALILWEGDEDFPPEGNILFDKNISVILSAEDISLLAGMVVYPLMGMANK